MAHFGVEKLWFLSCVLYCLYLLYYIYKSKIILHIIIIMQLFIFPSKNTMGTLPCQEAQIYPIFSPLFPFFLLFFFVLSYFSPPPPPPSPTPSSSFFFVCFGPVAKAPQWELSLLCTYMSGTIKLMFSDLAEVANDIAVVLKPRHM